MSPPSWGYVTTVKGVKMGRIDRISQSTLTQARAFRDLFFHPPERALRVWAYQLPDGSYRPGEGPLILGNILNHFRGEKTLAAYLLDASDNLKFLVLDIDVAKPVFQPLREEGLGYLAIFERFKPVLLETARDILDRLCHYFLRSYIAFSGSKGLHIYIFFDDIVPARKPRSIALRVLEGVSWPNELITVTVYPRQTSRGSGYGDIIKLPWGIHQVSGERTHFINRINGEPLDLLPTDIVRSPVEDLPDHAGMPVLTTSKDLEFQIAEEIPRAFIQLMRQCPRVRELFEGRGKRTGDLSRSGIDMTLLGVAINAGITDPGELTAIIAYRPNAKVTDHPRPCAYLRKTVSKALEYFSPDSNLSGNGTCLRDLT